MLELTAEIARGQIVQFIARLFIILNFEYKPCDVAEIRNIGG